MIVNLDGLHGLLMTFAMILPRMVAIFIVLPFMSNGILSGVVRSTIGLSMVLVVYPAVVPSLPHEMSMLFFGAVLFKEILIGVILGFASSMIFWVAEGIGYFIDNQRGTTMASIMDPMSGEQTSPLGSMLLQLMATLFFAGGGFLAMLSGIYKSYQLWPVFEFFPVVEQGFALFFLEMADHLMRAIVLFSAPVIIAVFLSEFGLGLTNRFAPQLQVFFLAMPIKSAVGIFVLILYLSYMPNYAYMFIIDGEVLEELLKGVLHE